MNEPSQDLDVWLAPQERFDAIEKQARRKHPRDLCDLAYANAWEGPVTGVKDAIRHALDDERSLELQYTPYGGATIARRHVARWLDQIHGCEDHWHHYHDVILLPGAMAALNVAFKALAPNIGDEVLVLTPCWLDYPLYLAQQGLVPRLLPLRGAALDLDLDAIESAINDRTRACIISQPHNPTGRIWKRTELGALASLLQANNIRLISDECHRLVSAVDVPSAASVDRDALTIFSFGKALSLQGQRLGFVSVHPKSETRVALRARLLQLARAQGFCTPTALMQRALPALMRLKPDLSVVMQRRARAQSALVKSGYEVPPSDATFFLYPRSPHGDSESFVQRAADRGVLVLPSTLFHHPDHFRLSVTGTDAMLDRGLAVLDELARNPA